MPDTPKPGQQNDQKSNQPDDPKRPMETRPDEKSGGGSGSDRKQGSGQR